MDLTYTPSNFDPSGIDAQALEPLTYLDCGESVFDSETGAFTNFCGNEEPGAVLRTQSGGPEVIVQQAKLALPA